MSIESLRRTVYVNQLFHDEYTIVQVADVRTLLDAYDALWRKVHSEPVTNVANDPTAARPNPVD